MTSVQTGGSGPSEADSIAKARARRLAEYRDGHRRAILVNLAFCAVGLAFFSWAAFSGRPHSKSALENPLFALLVIGFLSGCWELRSIGTVSLEDLENRWRAAARLKALLSSSRAWFTWTIGACLVGVALLQMHVGLERSVAAAGLVKDAVRGGQVWRLMTAETLHGGLMHLWFNLGALIGLGRAVESIASRGAMTTTFTVSAIVASVFSLILAPNTTSVGASGGIMGLVGFLGVAGYYRRSMLPGLMKSMLASVALMALVGLWSLAYIDNAAHLGGLLAGVAIGSAVIDKHPEAPGLLRDGRREWPGVLSLAIVIAACALSVALMLR